MPEQFTVQVIRAGASLVGESGGERRKAVACVDTYTRGIGNPRLTQVAAASLLSSSATPVPDGLCAIYSGSYAEIDGGDPFEDDPRTWGPKGWDALENAVRTLGTAADHLAVRPHARHVISDPLSLRRLAEASWAGRLSILHDPISMLTPSMAHSGPDTLHSHLIRLFESVADVPVARVAGIVLSGFTAAPDSAGCIVPCPLTHPANILPVNILRDLVAAHISPVLPLILLDGDVPGQLSAL